MYRNRKEIIGKNKNLVEAIFLVILTLNGGAKEDGGVVYQIRRMLSQIQHHEIEIQPYHTTGFNQHSRVKSWKPH